MTRKGWPREAGRHSLAARGVRTKKRTPKYESAVTMKQANPLKEQPQTEEALQTICATLEQTATKEAESPEDAPGLLADDEWLTRHLNELLSTFELNDGARTTLVAQVRRKYTADGVEV
jgi:hypothetical protein